MRFPPFNGLMITPNVSGCSLRLTSKLANFWFLFNALRGIGCVIAFIIIIHARTAAAQAPTESPLAARQKAENRVAQLSTVIRQRWQSFAASLHTTNPEERIRRIDAWRAEQQSIAQELQAAQKQLADSSVAAITGLKQTHPPAAFLTSPTDPLLSDIQSTDEELAAALCQMLAMQISPAQRIKDMDDFLVLNYEALAERQQKEEEWIRRLRATARPQASVGPATAQGNSLTSDSNFPAWMESIHTLSPTERIKAIDAAWSNPDSAKIDRPALSTPK